MSLVGEYFRLRRTAARLTLRAIGEECCVNHMHLSKVERGKEVLNKDLWLVLEENVPGVSLADLKFLSELDQVLGPYVEGRSYRLIPDEIVERVLSTHRRVVDELADQLQTARAELETLRAAARRDVPAPQLPQAEGCRFSLLELH